MEAGRRAGPVSGIDLETGRREVRKDLLPGRSEVESISKVVVSADGKGYADYYFRLLSGLFVVEGPRVKAALASRPAFVIGSGQLA